MADLETLLKPIRDDAPTGVNVRQAAGDVSFDKIKGLRTGRRFRSRPEGKGRDADWKGVAAECTAALQTKSQGPRVRRAPDRRVGAASTAWWVCATGSACERALRALLGPASPGLRARRDRSRYARDAAQSAGQRRRRRGGVRALPDPREASRPRTFRWSDFQNSSLVDARATGQNAAGTEDTARRRATSPARSGTRRIKSASIRFTSPRRSQLDECLAALGELRVQNEKHFGADAAPSLIPLADVLAEMRGHVHKQLPVEAAAAPVETAVGEAPAGQAAAAPAAPARPAGPPADREEALRRLEQVAEYFRKNEPHSPIAHLVERAARWGRMPLVDVLREVLDQNALAKVMDTLGVKPS